MPTETPFVPVASKAVVIGSGTILSIVGVTGATGTPTPLPIGEITGAKFSGWKTATAKNTNFDSGNVEQSLGTLFNWGTLTATYNNVVSNPGQLALLAAAKALVSYDFTLQLPPNPLAGQTTTGNLYTISGIVTSAGAFDTDQTKVSTADLEVTINNIVINPGS
jgi:hypothetical protein